jgi:hypothetical protein
LIQILGQRFHVNQIESIEGLSRNPGLAMIEATLKAAGIEFLSWFSVELGEA